MISLTLEPLPTLVIDQEVITGISILERLHPLRDISPEIEEMFQQAASCFMRTRVPRIGFRLAEGAVMPTKNVCDVGYDLTIISKVAKPTTFFKAIVAKCMRLFSPHSPVTTFFETSVAIKIPLGYYVELIPRSSLAKSGYMLANSVGVIDPGYLGTVKVPLVKIDPSMPDLVLPARVGQLVLNQYVVSDAYDATHEEVEQTTRGSGGFGSTG